MIPKLLTKYKNHELIVVHCMLSQVRGPTCAKMLHRELSLSDPTAQSPRIVVLKGGFSGWVGTYKRTRPDLFQNFIEDFYNYDL